MTVQYQVTVNAPGAGTPTGDDTTSCTGTIAAGQCTITFTSSGAKTLVATYAGDDKLSSKTSRNILIGGTGADKFTGSLVDAILIAGSTSYDDPTSANQKALCGIYPEWSRINQSYQTRINHLTGAASGDLNGTNLLKPGVTVFNDTSEDKLTGGLYQI